MGFEFLQPVNENVLAFREELSVQTLGKKIIVHTAEEGLPELEEVKIAFVGILDNRGQNEELLSLIHI